MDYKQKIQEGVKHATWTAQKTALTNCVFVCTNKEKKTFEFVSLDEVTLFPNTDKEVKLSVYLSNMVQRISILEKQNESLSEGLEKLAEYVDSQRFL